MGRVGARVRARVRVGVRVRARVGVGVRVRVRVRARAAHLGGQPLQPLLQPAHAVVQLRLRRALGRLGVGARRALVGARHALGVLDRHELHVLLELRDHLVRGRGEG